MLNKKLLTDIFGASLLLFEFSCFRNIVLPYHLRMLLRVYTRKYYLLSEIISLAFCPVLKKSTLLNIKSRGRQPIVPTSPNQLLVICVRPCTQSLKANKTFS